MLGRYLVCSPSSDGFLQGRRIRREIHLTERGHCYLHKIVVDIGLAWANSSQLTDIVAHLPLYLVLLIRTKV